MENKIQELTEKIYKEGVEKGNEEANRLVEEAKKQSAQLVAEAKKQAEAIVAQARKAAKELDANTKSELKLYAAQAVNALKSQVATLVTDTVVEEALKEQGKTTFFNEFILKLATSWSANEPIVISTSDAASLKAFFAAKAKNLLDNGVTIQQVNDVKTKFSIAPADGSYKVNFGEEEFENYFKAFLRPQIVEMLF